ncbi:MAG: hypothetical protein IPI67_24785 [Myxococcales bacterium]|nr:hypothetical protein [Myxococcales bacterium]
MGPKRRIWAAALPLVGLCACISTRQSLTPEAAGVRYVEGKLEPACDFVEEISVGRDWFVTDERQPAVSNDDVVVRMRRLSAKRGGNLVVILENEPPNNKCTGFNGLGRVYRCSAEALAALPPSGTKLSQKDAP